MYLQGNHDDDEGYNGDGDIDDDDHPILDTRISVRPSSSGLRQAQGTPPVF